MCMCMCMHAVNSLFTVWRESFSNQNRVIEEVNLCSFTPAEVTPTLSAWLSRAYIHISLLKHNIDYLCPAQMVAVGAQVPCPPHGEGWETRKRRRRRMNLAARRRSSRLPELEKQRRSFLNRILSSYGRNRGCVK